MAEDNCQAAQVRQLTILPLGRTVPAAAGLSILEAALAAGLRLRSSCRNGTCRECLAELRQGEVRYRIDWPGITPDERLEGGVLTCVAVPVGDVTVWQPRLDAPPLAR